MKQQNLAKAFLTVPRELPKRRPIEVRVLDYLEVYEPFEEEKVQQQASRCMDCGVPFCTSGCPLGNVIPDWNRLVKTGRWREAYDRLRATNNFPEFTGRVCPAPCESACVLGLIEPPVTIEQIEQEIIEHAFRAGWVEPEVPAMRTGRRVAIIGSGPSGLACADQLNQAGHTVVVYERDDRPGGLLRYGIPDFKLEKWVVERRVELMEAEGVTFHCQAKVGDDVPLGELEGYDAVVLCIGATKPRDVPVEGRDLDGVHFAWDYLWQQNKRVAGDGLEAYGIPEIVAEGKHVIVIGGGDTGSDCVGTANRQQAASVTQFELMPMPPEDRPEHQPWPFYPMKLKTSSSHEEGADRRWSIMTKRFAGTNGAVESLETVEVRLEDGRFAEVEGTAKTWPADLVLLAVGYLGPEREGLVSDLGLALDARGNIQTDDRYATSREGFFAAGDGRRGQSLVVWAISEGREAARSVDAYLVAETALPTKGLGDLPRIR